MRQRRRDRNAVDNDGEPDLPGEVDSARNFYHAREFGGQQNVADPAGGKRLGFAELRAADADRTPRKLHRGKRCRLVRLCVRAQLDAGSRDRRGHAVQVAFDDVEIEQQCRCIDALDGHGPRFVLWRTNSFRCGAQAGDLTRKERRMRA
jgi:hypothetical protein